MCSESSLEAFSWREPASASLENYQTTSAGASLQTSPLASICSVA
jgi:hypothetical protein